MSRFSEPEAASGRVSRRNVLLGGTALAAATTLATGASNGSAQAQAYVLIAAQPVVGKFLATFKDYPPSQRPASFTIDRSSRRCSRTSMRRSSGGRRVEN